MGAHHAEGAQSGLTHLLDEAVAQAWADAGAGAPLSVYAPPCCSVAVAGAERADLAAAPPPSVFCVLDAGAGVLECVTDCCRASWLSSSWSMSCSSCSWSCPVAALAPPDSKKFEMAAYTEHLSLVSVGVRYAKVVQQERSRPSCHLMIRGRMPPAPHSRP